MRADRHPAKVSSSDTARPTTPHRTSSPFSLPIQGASSLSLHNDPEKRPYSACSFASTATSVVELTSYESHVESPLHTREQRSQYLPEVLERERRARQREDDEHTRRDQELHRMREYQKELEGTNRLSTVSQSLEKREDGDPEPQSDPDGPPRPRQDSIASTLASEFETPPKYQQHRIRSVASADQLPTTRFTRNSIVSSSLKRVSRAMTFAGRIDTGQLDHYTRRHRDDRLSQQIDLSALKTLDVSTKSFLNLTSKSSAMSGDDDDENSSPPRQKSEEDSIFSRLPDEAQREMGEITYPDGGFHAWVQVFAAFLLLCTGWGIVVSYGAFETYYSSLNPPLANSALTSLIGSIQAFLLLFVGFFTGRLYDGGHFRAIMSVGSILMWGGLFATGFCEMTYWKILLCQGVVTGTGMGFLFTPSVAVVSTYFYKKRALANGFVASGSSVGGIVFPILTRKLIPAVGFRNTMIVNSFIVLTLLIISNLILSPRKDIPPRKKGPMIDVKSFKDPTYMLFVFGMLAAFSGLYMPFFYVEVWAKKMGLERNGLETFYLVSILNGASTFGRVVPNFIADRIGSINMQIPAMVISGILILCWLPMHTFESLIAFIILYGFFSGVFISLPPASVASITPDVTYFGVRMGMMFSIASVGSLTGTPISGAMIHAQGGSLDGARIWSGCIMLFSAALIIAARINASGWRWRYKI
ncbi:hypothetical protein H072_6069 [Dactylellina haptotyla CBS 200.50]|uniref:Major facilitator superfamily (MFS) profile domain-containing protein n=1 Tax=Dactylellina haptotyla (strain CBS 200.50) TaxID=1284197 RepID=S8AB22_DACHA|nr:hypothetical protein H072_6069 [Dactylellina haptotyla CBS 200.50]